MKRLLYVVFILAMALQGCATGEKAQNLREGMTKAEVVSQLGQPDGFKRDGEYEALQYTNRLISGWSWDRTDYVVILKDGKLVEYGPGEVRQRDPSASTLVVVPVQ
ncbi:hypothetical protein ACPF7Z_03855 [Halomonas sp. GXIMD04776]|uniref:hypothetical protein n=1 Tax=Halomonas sp. GXIMD04776 TaxID=3415605 RepID=UPI003CB8A36D